MEAVKAVGLDLLAREAHALHERVVGLVQRGNAVALQLGGALSSMHDRELYRALGYATWQEYVAQPEISITVRTAYRWMSFAECATVAELSPADAATLGPVKAEIIEPLVHVLPPAKVAELVEDAKTLAVSDLRRKVNDAIDGPIPDDREWLEETAQRIIRRAAKLSRDEAPMNVLDEIVSIGMQGIERLKAKI